MDTSKAVHEGCAHASRALRLSRSPPGGWLTWATIKWSRNFCWSRKKSEGLNIGFLLLWHFPYWFHFIAFCRHLISYKLKVGSNLVWHTSVDTIFAKAFSHFLSLSHVLVIFQTVHTFSWLLLVVVITDVIIISGTTNHALVGLQT